MSTSTPATASDTRRTAARAGPTLNRTWLGGLRQQDGPGWLGPPRQTPPPVAMIRAHSVATTDGFRWPSNHDRRCPFSTMPASPTQMARLRPDILITPSCSSTAARVPPRSRSLQAHAGPRSHRDDWSRRLLTQANAPSGWSRCRKRKNDLTLRQEALKLILKTRRLMIRHEGCGVLCCRGGLYGDTPGIFPPYAGKATDGSSPRTDV